MTTQRWNDDRLDRLASLVEANRLQIDANSRDIANNAAAISSLLSCTSELQNVTSQLITVLGNQGEANTQIFQALIQEIRGLRVEQRRILDHLFGEQQS